MVPAPTLEIIFSHKQQHPRALCCILFAPPFSKTGREGVIPRIAYLNERSASDIHFYCAGYGGYWHKSTVPDMEVIGEIRYSNGVVIPWAFSQRQFAAFINELEAYTSWTYSGETEMIVLDPELTLEDCIVFDLDRMTTDAAIDRPSEIFESLIQYARKVVKDRSAWDFSEGRVPGLFGKAVVGVLSEGTKSLGKVWKAGRHYATRSIKR